jgi:hypothetical protein
MKRLVRMRRLKMITKEGSCHQRIDAKITGDIRVQLIMTTIVSELLTVEDMDDMNPNGDKIFAIEGAVAEAHQFRVAEALIKTEHRLETIKIIKEIRATTAAERVSTK